jgi:antitoxin FitA
MATMTIRNLDEALKARLRVRAAQHGKSIEEEARDILCAPLSTEAKATSDIGLAIHTRFAALGGIDLPTTQRESIRDPAGFGS